MFPSAQVMLLLLMCRLYIEQPQCNAVSVGNGETSGHDIDPHLCLFVLLAENAFIPIPSPANKVSGERDFMLTNVFRK